MPSHQTRSRMSEPSTQQLSSVEQDIARLEDVGFLTSMLITLLGNYAQTGHFGGPLAYVPYVVTSHLIGPAAGGLRFDYRRPKHPYADKFMLAGGHNAPVTYALWMVMGEALSRRYVATNDDCYRADPSTSILSIDALGFRRGQRALDKLLGGNGLADDPLFQQAKLRGIRALSGHSETTDLTNDVNGGPSGVGVATAAGKAAFWDIVGAPLTSPKIVAASFISSFCIARFNRLLCRIKNKMPGSSSPTTINTGPTTIIPSTFCTFAHCSREHGSRPLEHVPCEQGTACSVACEQ